jgi:hypothetical protein
MSVTPGEVTREFYRRAGRLQERAKWLEAIAAMREKLHETKLAEDSEPTDLVVEACLMTLNNLERLTRDEPK